MKRLLLIASALLLITPSWSFAEESGNATITSVHGEVALVRDGVSSPAKEGTPLKEGDKLQTAEGTADFSMNGLAGCRVLPAGECEIKDAKKKTMRVKVGRGKSIFNLEKLSKDSSFKVQTPTAIASVRGTQFSGSVTPAGSTFSVRDDSVEVYRMSGDQQTGNPIIVEEGFSCDIDANDVHGLNTRRASNAELTAIEQVASVKTCS